jgi:hypothetical protein
MEIFKLIIFCLVIVIWIISEPYLKKFRIYQFSMLLFFSFAVGILLTDSICKYGWVAKNLVLYFLLIGGIIYQAIRFYRDTIASKP